MGEAYKSGKRLSNQALRIFRASQCMIRDKLNIRAFCREAQSQKTAVVSCIVARCFGKKKSGGREKIDPAGFI
jgi:hypothetical protein